jgi:hypothetical protein
LIGHRGIVGVCLRLLCDPKPLGYAKGLQFFVDDFSDGISRSLDIAVVELRGD